MRVKRIQMALMIGLALSLAAANIAAKETNDDQQKEQVDRAPAATEELFNLEFPGGTALDFIKALRQARPNANIVVKNKDEMEKVQVPSATLRNVAMSTAMAFLDNQERRHGEKETRIGVKRFQASANAQAVYEVRGYPWPPSLSGPTTLSAFAVWSMREHLDAGMAAEDLLSAVQMVASAVETDVKPEIKFHESTALLVFRGTHKKQSQLIEQALAQMKNDAQERAEQREQRRTQIENVKDKLISYQSEIAIQQKRLEATRNRLSLRREALERFKADHQGDQQSNRGKLLALIGSMSEAELEVAEAQAKLQSLKARAAQLKEKLDRLHQTEAGSSAKSGV